MLLALDWKDKPDRDGYWWLVSDWGLYDGPVKVFGDWFANLQVTCSIEVESMKRARWLWLGDIEQAAKEGVVTHRPVLRAQPAPVQD